MKKLLSLLITDPAKQYIGVTTFDLLPQYTATSGENIFWYKIEYISKYWGEF